MCTNSLQGKDDGDIFLSMVIKKPQLATVLSNLLQVILLCLEGLDWRLPKIPSSFNDF